LSKSHASSSTEKSGRPWKKLLDAEMLASASAVDLGSTRLLMALIIFY
jgi:hypothetical protein